MCRGQRASIFSAAIEMSQPLRAKAAAEMSRQRRAKATEGEPRVRAKRPATPAQLAALEKARAARAANLAAKGAQPRARPKREPKREEPADLPGRSGPGVNREMPAEEPAGGVEISHRHLYMYRMEHAPKKADRLIRTVLGDRAPAAITSKNRGELLDQVFNARPPRAQPATATRKARVVRPTATKAAPTARAMKKADEILSGVDDDEVKAILDRVIGPAHREELETRTGEIHLTDEDIEEILGEYFEDKGVPAEVAKSAARGFPSLMNLMEHIPVD